MSEDTSHRQILKSTSIVGGSQILVILLTLCRTKIMAVLLGPVGVGLVGMFQVIIDLVKQIFGTGISFSAVKKIAQISVYNNPLQISTTILIIKRWLWATGILGMLFVILFSREISNYSFGNSSYTLSVILISVMVLMLQLSSGQVAMLQGLRRIKDMAKANVLSAFFVLLFVTPVYWIWGLNGVVPGMILMAGITLSVSYYYTRKIGLNSVRVSYKTTFLEGREMIKLGAFTMLAGLCELATLYWVRYYVSHKAGLDSMGQFIAASNISHNNLSLVLGALGADFFPKLSSIIDDKKSASKLINDQTEVALLIACPLIIGIISFAYLIVNILYSKAFVETSGILYWQLIGDVFKILNWVLLFYLLAKGRGGIFILFTILWSVLYIVGIKLGWTMMGIEVTGLAFTIAYIVSTILLLVIIKYKFDLHLEKRVVNILLSFLALIAFTYIVKLSLPEKYQIISGTLLTLFAIYYSYLRINRFVNIKELVGRFIKR